MLSVALKVLAALAIIYALVVLLAWRFQDRIAFPGSGGPLPAPAAVGIPDGALITVTTEDEDGALRSVIIAPVLGNRKCFGLLYCNNSKEHEHYEMSDLDYLMMIATVTAAAIESI